METSAKMQKVLVEMKSADKQTIMQLQEVWERLIEMMSSVDIRETMYKVRDVRCCMLGEKEL
jgi:hypothetical protein